jgi:hypothetical protein
MQFISYRNNKKNFLLFIMIHKILYPVFNKMFDLNLCGLILLFVHYKQKT